MTVHIDELDTEVELAPDAAVAAGAAGVAGAPPEPWQHEAEWRVMQDRLRREVQRTAAEAYDD